MKHKIFYALTAFAIAGGVAAPDADAALSFDLNARPWIGIQTIQGPFTFDGDGVNTVGGSPAQTNATASIGFSGDQISYDSSNVAAGAWQDQQYVDLLITNTNTTVVPGALDGLNLLKINYTFGGTGIGGAFQGVNVLFAQGNQVNGDQNSFFSVGSLSGGGNSFIFSSRGAGLDLYPNVVAPLIPAGADGTLRFVFGSQGFAGSPGTQGGNIDLFVSSITAAVPEPSSALLLSGCLSLFGLLYRRKRQLVANDAQVGAAA